MNVVLYVVVFFFFKQQTAYEMRISDWSSVVCSSDLAHTCHLDNMLGGRRRRRCGHETTKHRREKGRLHFMSRASVSGSEESRVGKEWVSKCRSRRWQDHKKKQNVQTCIRYNDEHT